MSLTSGAISQLWNDKKLIEPVLQIIKTLAPPSLGQIKVLLSDGSKFTMASVPSAEIQQFSIISLDRYENYKEKGLVVRKCSVLDGDKELIGNPTNIDPSPDAIKFENKVPKEVKDSRMKAASFLKMAGSVHSVKSMHSVKSVGEKKEEVKKRIPTASGDGLKSLNPEDLAGKSIKLKVYDKPPTRPWKKGEKSGQIANVDFEDESGTKIRTTFFSDCDPSYIEFVKNRMYVISRFSLKRIEEKNKKYYPFDNDYELVFNAGTIIEAVKDAAESRYRFNLCKIQDLTRHKEKDSVDIAGVILQVSELKSSVSATGKATYRRVLKIADDSNYTIDLTIWGEGYREKLSGENCRHCFIAVRNCQVSHFNGKLSLTSGYTSTIYVNGEMDEPELTRKNAPDLHPLFDWWELCKNNAGVLSRLTDVSSIFKTDGGAEEDKVVLEESLGDIKTIKEMKEMKTSKTREVYTVCATLSEFHTDIKENGSSWFYSACSTPSCGKKISNKNFCEKCKTQCNDPIYRIAMKIRISDHTMGLDCIAFDCCKIFFGDKTIDDMITLNEDSPAEFKELMARHVGHDYYFKITGELKSIKDEESKWHYRIDKIIPINLVQKSSKKYVTK